MPDVAQSLKMTPTHCTPELPPVRPGIEFTYAGPDWIPSIDCPKRLPRGAKHVATVEWEWSPWHSRQDAYHLSTNKSRTHWILWTGYYDDNNLPMKWEHAPYAFCVKKGIPSKIAAVYLLLEGWRVEMTKYDSPDEPFHFITTEGLLLADELNLVAEAFWGTKPEAPSPAEIIRNIRENSTRLINSAD